MSTHSDRFRYLTPVERLVRELKETKQLLEAQTALAELHERSLKDMSRYAKRCEDILKMIHRVSEVG